jgi:hypothetical protein
MKQILKFKEILLSAVLIIAAITAQAQTTTFAIIAQTPVLPSPQELAGDEMPTPTPTVTAVDKFEAEIDRLREKNEEIINSTITVNQSDINDVKAKANQQAVQMTGFSIEQLKSMTPEQQQNLGNQLASQKIAGANAMIANSAAQLGLSSQELAAMQNMSDAEIEAYMKSAAVTQKRDAYNAQNPVNPEENARQLAKNRSMQKKTETIIDAQQEQKKFMEQKDYIDNLHKKEIAEIVVKLDEIYQRHKANLDATWEKLAPCLDGKTPAWATEQYCKAAENASRAARISYYTDCYTIWRNQVVKMQGRYKVLHTDAQKIDEIANKSLNASASLDQRYGDFTKKATPKNTYSHLVTVGYLDISESVTNLPSKEE